MQSLELNRAYYHNCVASILEAHCPEIAKRHAAALIGWGSEVLGNDDEHSKIYGWGPRLVLFLTQEDHRTWGEKVYEILNEHIPPLFLGQPTRFTDPELGAPQPTTDSNGFLSIPITICNRFTKLYLGITDTDITNSPLSAREWLLIPEAGLLRLTAGEVYHDSIGELTKLREYFNYFPDDVWRYRLAYQWTTLAWDIDLVGYCAHRGDTLSARIAASESVKRIMSLVFLLNRRYKPGYLKWLHRQFYKLPHLVADIGSQLEDIITTDDSTHVIEQFYPILDRLIEFQCHYARLPMVEYKQPAALDRGFFAYNLQPIINSLRDSIQGELRDVSFKIGALDQWITDQDLLMEPNQLQSLRGIYNCKDPMTVLSARHGFEDRCL